MPISFNCPSCQKKLTVKDEMAGKVAQCPCGAKLKIPQAQAASATQATAGSALESAFAGAPAGNPQQAAVPAGAQASVPQANAAAMPQDINPDFKVQCLQCGQQYPMRPDLFGQTVTCKCGAPITFEDPLGTGGILMNRDPLGLDAANEDASKPLAYQSQTEKQAESKQQARSREEEVLKMYIKDDGLEGPSAAGKKAEKTGPARMNAKRASFGIRFLALLIDGVIMAAINQATAWPLVLMASSLFEIDLAGNPEAIIQKILLAFLPFMLVVIGITLIWLSMEVAMGKTPGKIILGIEILDAQGRKPDANEALSRGLFKYGGSLVSGASFVFLFGQMIMVTQIVNGVGAVISLVFLIGCFGALGESKLALHDKVSNTQVVHVD